MRIPGLVFNCHQRDPRAAESREAVPCLQVLPVPLSGDGRGETRIRQGAAAGRLTLTLTTHSDSLSTGKKTQNLISHENEAHPSLYCLCFYLFAASVPEAGQASVQPHSAHSGSQGGNEE